MAINKSKVVVGGIAAGLFMGIVDVLVMKFVTGARMAAEANAFKAGLGDMHNAPGAWMSTLVMDIVMGLMLVWLYAAIRSRFGAGMQTAVYAAIFMWLVGSFFTLGYAMMGMMSWGLWGMYAVIWLVNLIISAGIGGRLYSEEGAAA